MKLIYMFVMITSLLFNNVEGFDKVEFTLDDKVITVYENFNVEDLKKMNEEKHKVVSRYTVDGEPYTDFIITELKEKGVKNEDFVSDTYTRYRHLKYDNVLSYTIEDTVYLEINYK